MNLRPTKAAGCFKFHKEGSFELFVHMEADPDTFSFAEFSFDTVLSRPKARAFAGTATYLLRHAMGSFVITVTPSTFRSTAAFRSLWREADIALAKRNIWLFSTTCTHLLREPHWSNALKIYRAAQVEITPADRARVIEHLSTTGQATLLECARLCKESCDSCDAVLKLVSAGVLKLSLGDPLTTQSFVRLHNPNRPAHALQALEGVDSCRAGS